MHTAGNDRRLMWHGVFLFLVGLLTGLAEQHFTNVRMGLAAHLEGVLNGILLIALGAIWSAVRLPTNGRTIAFWLVLYGSYANWAFTTLAAVFGTAALSPLTAAGHSGQPWQETLVTAGFTSVGVTMIASSVMILLGPSRQCVVVDIPQLSRADTQSSLASQPIPSSQDWG